MKKINLKGIKESLSDNEMKQVKGGLSGYESKVAPDGQVGGGDSGGGGRSGVCSSADSCTGIHLCWTQARGDGYCKYKDGVCGCF